MSRTARSYLLLTIAAAIWGLAFVAQRAGSEFVDAFSFNAVRFVLGALSLLPVMAFLGRKEGTRPHPWRGVLLPGFVVGVILFAGSTFQQLGVERTTAGNAGFVTGLYIVTVPLVGLLQGHRPSRWLWLGVVAAMSGLYLLTVTDSFSMGAGDALVLVGSVCWTAHIVSIEYFSRRVDPLRLAFVQFVVCAALSTIVAVTTQPHPFAGMVEAALPLAYGGIMSVGVGFTLQVVGQAGARASVAALIMSLEALFAALGGALLLGETMSVRGYAGCALMLAGILLAQIGGPPHAVEPGLALDDHSLASDPEHDPVDAPPQT